VLSPVTTASVAESTTVVVYITATVLHGIGLTVKRQSLPPGEAGGGVHYDHSVQQTSFCSVVLVLINHRLLFDWHTAEERAAFIRQTQIAWLVCKHSLR